MEPLVSVITPAYNAAPFIGDTVRSVLMQTYRNLEIIVADDGSTDETANIVKALAKEDPRVKYVHQSNAGQSAARNAAIAEAKGVYLAFLDADDLFLPSKLKKQVQYLEAHPECGLSYCKIHHFFNDDPRRPFYFSVPSPSGVLFEELLKTNFINPLSVVLRKELLDRYGAFEPTFRRLDEQYLWLKLARHGVQFCYLPEALANYRIHRTSLSNESVYFKETEAQVLRLLEMMKNDWLAPEEVQKYHIDDLEKRARKRLFIGKMIAGKNIFSRLLLKVYYWKRMRRMHPDA